MKNKKKMFKINKKVWQQPPKSILTSFWVCALRSTQMVIQIHNGRCKVTQKFYILQSVTLSEKVFGNTDANCRTCLVLFF